MVQLVLVQRLSRALSIAFSLSLGLLVVTATALFWASGHREKAKKNLRRWQEKWARVRKRPADPKHLMASVDRPFDAFRVRKTRGWKAPAAAAALGVLFDMGAMYWLFVAAGRQLTPGKVLAGYA